jgi:hypothetical protein
MASTLGRDFFLLVPALRLALGHLSASGSGIGAAVLPGATSRAHAPRR